MATLAALGYERIEAGTMSLELSTSMQAGLTNALGTLVSSADLHWVLAQPPHVWGLTGAQFPERAAGLPDRLGVVRIMEVLQEGIILIDVAGSIVYENPALEGIATVDPEAPMLKRECVALAQRLFATARQSQGLPSSTEERVRTAAARYRIRGALVEPRIFDERPISLVVVRRTTPEKIPLDILQSRYGLTPREALIAQHLAEARTNVEIAGSLGISLHTVRRHVERVLPKLGVHSRAAVAPKLAADA